MHRIKIGFGAFLWLSEASTISQDLLRTLYTPHACTVCTHSAAAASPHSDGECRHNKIYPQLISIVSDHPHTVHSFYQQRQHWHLINIYLLICNLFFIRFVDFNCPDSKQPTKKNIKIGAGESVMYNTNPDGADK